MFGISSWLLFVIYLVVQLILFLLCYKNWNKVKGVVCWCWAILALVCAIYFCAGDVFYNLWLEHADSLAFLNEQENSNFWRYFNEVVCGILAGSAIILGPVVAAIKKLGIYSD
jgi:hypothetical protein